MVPPLLSAAIMASLTRLTFCGPPMQVEYASWPLCPWISRRLVNVVPASIRRSLLQPLFPNSTSRAADNLTAEKVHATQEALVGFPTAHESVEGEPLVTSRLPACTSTRTVERNSIRAFPRWTWPQEVLLLAPLTVSWRSVSAVHRPVARSGVEVESATGAVQ
jgi:hypothetical protein